MIKVSIVVPVHNTAEYLKECVASLLAQTLQDIEVILVENASTDGSLSICKELAAGDSRVRYVSLEIGDLSFARNTGVKMANGEYVGFVDSDDEIDPDMYKRMYDAAVRHDADAVNCNSVKVYPHRPAKYKFLENGEETVLSSKEMVALNLMEKVSLGACTMLIKKKIVEKIRFPEHKLYEDRACTFLFYADAGKCVQINRSFYHYHQYRGNICRWKSFRHSFDCAEADIKRLRFIQESGLFSEDEKAALASRSAESFLRKLNRMRKSASTEEETVKLQDMKRAVSLIPDGCILSLKAKIIRFFVERSIAFSPASEISI